MSKDWEQLAQGWLAHGEAGCNRLGPWLAALGPSGTTSWPARTWPAMPWAEPASASTIRLGMGFGRLRHRQAGWPIVVRVHRSPGRLMRLVILAGEGSWMPIRVRKSMRTSHPADPGILQIYRNQHDETP